MVNYTSGLICVPMPKSRLDELELPLMVESSENEEVHHRLSPKPQPCLVYAKH